MGQIIFSNSATARQSSSVVFSFLAIDNKQIDIMQPIDYSIKSLAITTKQ
jgi:hypothetical protein